VKTSSFIHSTKEEKTKKIPEDTYRDTKDLRPIVIIDLQQSVCSSFHEIGAIALRTE
jgi:hypothetical protein